MSTRPFFATELEGVATFWRIERTDGVTLGFTSHDRDLAFDGVLHRAAPGMVPSAIRRTAAIESEALEVQGALAHDAISQTDLAAGRYDDAAIAIGLVDWETLARATLFRGQIGEVNSEDNGFTAELRSAKALLERDVVPRTSPTCRAAFCDAQCGLSPARHTYLATVAALDVAANAVSLDGAPPPAKLLHGRLRPLDGPFAGIWMDIADIEGGALVLSRELDGALAAGDRVFVREGCDHTIATCAGRFANAANFRGEPFLPGNDLLARYPTSAG